MCLISRIMVIGHFSIKQ